MSDATRSQATPRTGWAGIAMRYVALVVAMAVLLAIIAALLPTQGTFGTGATLFVPPFLLGMLLGQREGSVPSGGTLWRIAAFTTLVDAVLGAVSVWGLGALDPTTAAELAAMESGTLAAIVAGALLVSFLVGRFALGLGYRTGARQQARGG